MFLIALCALFVLMLGHQLSHLLVARCLGFETPVFGIGLPLGRYLRLPVGETEFRIHPLLVGGYVTVPELDAPSDLPLWKRLMVAVSGVIFYLLVAWLVQMTMLNTVGLPVMRLFVSGLSHTNSIAKDAGIREGDEFLSVSRVKVDSVDSLIGELRKHSDTTATLNIARADQTMLLEVKPDQDGKIGVQVESKAGGFKHVNPLLTPFIASYRLMQIHASLFNASNDLLSKKVSAPAESQAPTESDRPRGLMAVIAIVESLAASDPNRLYDIISMVTVDLAIFNLLPLPGFDGSHALAIIISAMKGKRLFENRLLKFLFAGLVGFAALNLPTQVCLLRGKTDDEKKSTEDSNAE